MYTNYKNLLRSFLTQSSLMSSISQRYYYYIHNGIDTEHVAPMEDLWLDHVLALVPNRCFLNFKIFFI